MSTLHSHNSSLASFTISIYSIGYVFGPLVIAPISEIWGRRYILWSASVISIASLAICGASKDLALFLTFRGIQGFAGVGFVLLGPAVVADLMPVEKRGLSLSIMSAGPVVLSAVCLITIIIFKETYGPVLQARRNKDLEKTTDVASAKQDTRKIFILAWKRPFRLLLFTPIVPLLGLFAGITNSYAFICFATVGTMFQDR
ncbi:MAG: hypothetical protein L6R37_003003 [Teloschistes peruensis]|nr:MAG: hypothetical protein L6R37_003003 [Teloschistes peruensis]